MLLLTKSLSLSLPIKTWEEDVGVKTYKLTEAEKAATWPSLLTSSQKEGSLLCSLK